MWTDEGKVSQILRNFISNAIKFTEEGEVRVSAQLVDNGHAISFSVSDTGIGIALPDQQRIFEEFSQIDNPIQGKVKGTGLGLPLCRKLAELLGGTIGVTSSLGEGSTFHVTLPVAYVPADHELLKMPEVPETQPEAGRVPILVVEDEAETRLLYEKYLRNSPFQPIPAGSIRQARETLRRQRVAAIILDVLLPDEAAWQWLSELKGQEATRHVPVLVATSVEDPRKALALGADDYCLKPIQRAWLLERLKRVTGTADEEAKRTAPLVLIIDDQEADRYILRRHISVIDCSIAESATGETGLKLARDLMPALILLDLNMPGMDGFSVLEQLHENPATATIPVVIVTSQMLMPGRETVLAYASAVLKKDELSQRSLQQALIEAGFASVGVAEGSDVGNSD
jgi:CheY-like chemotaxis protein